MPSCVNGNSPQRIVTLSEVLLSNKLYLFSSYFGNIVVISRATCALVARVNTLPDVILAALETS